MATKNRIFISFAADDAYARDFLVGQAANAKTPFEFVDMSVKEPWEDNWKTRCRTKIKGCDGVIALISKKTMAADGARWEMKCANDEKISMIGDDFAFDRLFSSGIGDHDATGRLGFGFQTLDDDAVVQRTKLHGCLQLIDTKRIA